MEKERLIHEIKFIESSIEALSSGFPEELNVCEVKVLGEWVSSNTNVNDLYIQRDKLIDQLESILEYETFYIDSSKRDIDSK